MCLFTLKGSKRGFTLVEALIYIALFVLIIGGGFVGAYQIIEGTQQIERKTIIEAEANFLLRKLDWALSGSRVIEPFVGVTGDKLGVDTDGNFVVDIEFELDGNGVVTINGTELTSDRIEITDLLFTHVPVQAGRPEALEIVFKVNGEQFGTTTRYLRIQ